MNRKITIWLALAVLILVSLFPVFLGDFTNYDDNVYVTSNPHLQAGLSIDSLLWALTASYHATWQPITWLSYLIDIELWGFDAIGFHLTNWLFHLGSVFLVFSVFYQMTGRIWAAAFLAAIFGVHPLNVEAVAWVSERKGILSSFLGLVAIRAYVFYCARPNFKRYGMVVLGLALSLMAKPMLVTLPCLFLLLDVWPLGRFEAFQQDAQSSAQSIYRLLVEKIPLFMLALIFCCIAYAVQNEGGAVASFQEVPFGLRIQNALLAYGTYLWKLLWPTQLAVFYPHPEGASQLWQVMISTCLLLGVSCLAWRMARHRYLLVGWLWFLGTLVPVIGLIQVGSHGLADRYTYIPMIGFWLMFAFGVDQLVQDQLSKKHVMVRILPGVASVIVVFAFAICSYHQAQTWRNSITLYEHAVSVGIDHPVIHTNLGQAYAEKNRINEAMVYYRKALSKNPQNERALNNVGLALVSLKRFSEARQKFEQALLANPNYADAHCNLATLLYLLKDYSNAWEEVVNCQEKGSQPHPDFVKALRNKMP